MAVGLLSEHCGLHLPALALIYVLDLVPSPREQIIGLR